MEDRTIINSCTSAGAPAAAASSSLALAAWSTSAHPPCSGISACSGGKSFVDVHAVVRRWKPSTQSLLGSALVECFRSRARGCAVLPAQFPTEHRWWIETPFYHISLYLHFPTHWVQGVVPSCPQCWLCGRMYMWPGGSKSKRLSRYRCTMHNSSTLEYSCRFNWRHFGYNN